MRKRLPKLAFLLALLLAVGCLALQRYPLLKVRSVEVIGSERISAAELGVTVGENAFAVDLEAVLDSVMTRSYVEGAAVSFDLQGNLIVELQEKQAACYLQAERLHGLSAACELLPLADTLVSLPLIRGVAVNNKLDYEFVDDASLHAAVKLVNLLTARAPVVLERISEVIIGEHGLQLVLEPGTARAEIGWGDYQRKLDMLELVLAGNRNPALRLDLRFGDMAIVKASDSYKRSEHGLR